MKRLLFNQLDEKGNAIRELIAAGGVIKIGTHHQCQLRVDDPFAMSLHATIKVDAKVGIWLNFCGSDPERSGINGRTCAIGIAHQIQIGDRLLVGKTVLQLVEISEAEDDRGLDDLSEVLERVAAFLGFKIDGSPSGTAKAFAHWLAFAEAFVMSPDGQHQATWTEVFLRVVGMRGMMAARSEASEAADVADAALRELVKRFPPTTAPEMVDEDPAPSDASKWQNATGCASPEAVRQELLDLHDRIACTERALAERDADLLKYSEEIDALRKKIESLRGTPMPTTEDGLPIVSPEIARARYELTTVDELRAALVEQSKRTEEYLAKYIGVSRERDKLSSEINEVKEERDSWRSDYHEVDEIIKGVRLAFGFKDGDFCDLVSEAQKAIMPKPKPENVAAQQKWAKVIITSDPGDVHGSPSCNYVGSEIGIVYKARMIGNHDNWIYLGKA